MSVNPFVFGSIVSGKSFTDRKNELREFASDLASGTNLIIFSPRRYGKTSLMMKVMEDLKKKDVMCAYIDLFPASSKERFIEIFTNSIAKVKGQKIQEIVNTIKEYIPGFKVIIRPDTGTGMESSLEIELAKNKRDVDETLNKLYDLPERIAKKKKKRLVVVFDEFQEIKNIDGDEIERSFRTKIQHHKSVSYVFMGSQRHLLDEIFNDKTRPLYRIGKPVNLNKIPASEFSTFINDKFADSNLAISKDVIDEILLISECHPYYTQQLCHEIWNVCQTMQSRDVKKEFVKIAKEQVMKNQNYAYTSMWESVKGKQRALLLALSASDEDQIYSSNFRTKFSLGPASTVEKAAHSLAEKGFVEREGGKYSISDIFFKEWLKSLR